MKKILHFFSRPVVVSLIGVILISLLIWFAGPQIKFGETDRALLDNPMFRLVGIIGVWLFWILNTLSRRWRNNSNNRRLIEDLQTNSEQYQRDDTLQPMPRQTAAALRQASRHFIRALEILKKPQFERRGRKIALCELPWYMIIGPPGAGKTTALANSNLKSPLAEQFGKAALSGVGGTRYCDWWFANEAVLIDAAGRYNTLSTDHTADTDQHSNQDSPSVADNAAWEGFLQLLKRHRRRRPLNGLIVAMSLHDLLTQSEEARVRQANAIRSQIDELMSALEVRFPIYVIFTKADLIAGFCEFFEDLSEPERQQVWGISLPNAPKATQAPDFDFINAEFDKLSARIHERVLWRLYPDSDLSRRGVVYGFSQQLGNLQTAIESFVRRTFIQNRYRHQPYLRGLYLTSAVQQGNPIDHLMNSISANFGFCRQSPSTPQQQQKSFFLANLLHRVIFPESEIAGSNVKYGYIVCWCRRLVYIALAGITLVAMLTWASNVTRSQLSLSEVRTYIEEFQRRQHRRPLDSHIGMVLQPLNALAKASMVYDQQKYPWLNDLGLYDKRVDDRADLAYASQLRQLLFPQLIAQLEGNLRQGYSGGDLYHTFRIYMMFNKIEHLDTALVADWFDRHWERQFRDRASYRQGLKKHLKALLTLGLESSALDRSLIADTRKLLLSVSVSQRIYSRIRTNPRYSRNIDMLNYMGAAVHGTYIIDERVKKLFQIPFMFTREGYQEIDLSPQSPVIADVVNDRWVLFDDEQAPVNVIDQDLDELSAQINDHYLSEYLQTWSDLYASLKIKPFSTSGGARQSLSHLTDPMHSPLMAILQVGSTHTQPSLSAMQKIADDKNRPSGGKAIAGVADTFEGDFEGNKVDKHFRSINDLLRETSARSAPMAATLKKIQQLQQLIADISISSNPSRKAFEIAKVRYQSASGNAITALSAHANDLPQPLKRWLQTLAGQTWKVVLGAARNYIDSAWQAQVYRPYLQGLAGRYPLNNKSKNELALLDFNEFFKPGGKIDTFQQNYFNPFVDRRRSWRNRTVDGRSMGFSNDLLAQLKRALEIKKAFFGTASETPSVVVLELRPYRMDEKHARFILDIGEYRISYNHGPRFWKTVKWSGADNNKRIRITFEDLTGNIHSQTYDSPWAWFRLQDASQLRQASNSSVYLATFSVGKAPAPAHTITYELKVNSAANPFSSNLLSRFRCPSSI